MTYEEIRDWVASNVRSLVLGTSFTPDDVEHVSTCLEHLYRHYHEGYPIGDFLSAVASNDLSGAVVRADDTNRKALHLYVLFLANKLPWERVKARRKSEKALRELQAE